MTDSNSDSDDDDLLNFDPFAPSQLSQQSSTGSSQSTRGEDDETPSPKAPRKKVDDHKVRVEMAAKNIVDSNDLVSNKLRKPSELFWHKCGSKSGVRFYPCRLCPASEAFGLHFPNADKLNEDTHVLVQYIKYPDFELYKIVTRKALLEYHNGGNPDRWSEKFCELYAKQERIRHKKKRGNCNYSRTPIKGEAKISAGGSSPRRVSLTGENFELDRDVWVEILFLQQVLALAHQTKRDDQRREEEDERERIELQEEQRKEQQIASANRAQCNNSGSDVNDDGSLEEPYTQTINEDEEDRMYGYINSTTKSVERIRVGDWITYYSHIFTAGDERGRRVTEVLEVKPRDNPVLRLANGEFLPKDTQVKRIKVIRRNKLEDHPFGVFRPISGFTLRTMERKIPSGTTESERIGNIIEKNLRKFNDNLKRDGLESMSCFMNNIGKKSKKQKNVQEANSDSDFESPKKVRAKKSDKKQLQVHPNGTSSSSDESIHRAQNATKQRKKVAKVVREKASVNEIDLVSPASTSRSKINAGDIQARTIGVATSVREGMIDNVEMLTQASSSTNDSDFQRARRKFRKKKRHDEIGSYRNVDSDSDSGVSSNLPKSRKKLKRSEQPKAGGWHADEIKELATGKPRSKKLPKRRVENEKSNLPMPQLQLSFTKTNAKQTTRSVEAD